MQQSLVLSPSAGGAEILRETSLSIPQVHERHLSTDFLLAVLHNILPRRPELKLVLMSATIDTTRFAT